MNPFKSLKFNIFILFIFTFSIFLFFNNLSLNKNINHELDINKEKIKTLINSSLFHFKQATKNVNHFIVNNDKIIDILSKAENSNQKEKTQLRNKLYKMMQLPYERLKNVGVLQFQFVFPSNESFLRIHFPSKYGDNLTNIRETFNYVHKHKKAISAFENGKFLHSFRYVYPLFNKKNKYIGAFEISYSSFNIQKDLMQINGLHNHFIVKKELLKKHKLNQSIIDNMYVTSIENDEYLFNPNKLTQNHSNMYSYESKILKKHKQTILEKMEKGLEFSLYTKLDKNVKNIIFLPIKNLNGDVDAYIVVYKDSNYILNLINNFILINILIFIALAGFFIFIYFLKEKKNILDSLVKIKTAQLKDSLSIINEFVLYSKTDLNGKIIDISDEFCKLCEYEKKELLGKTHRILRHPDYKKHPIYTNMWETLKKGKTWKGVVKDVSKSGKSFWLETTIVPVYKDAKIVAYDAFRRNITDKKELEELNNNLEKLVLEGISKNIKQKEQLLKQEKIVAIGNMMDAIAHQWKQPLSVISMALNNFLSSYFLSGKVSQKSIDELEKETNIQINHLVTTIDEFREFFRPNQKLTKVNIKELTDSTLKLMHSTLAHNGINIDVSISQDTSLNCIPNEFKHILINLINNSKDAFNEKNIENRTIQIKSTSNENSLSLTIIDNAGGIPSEIIDKIFIPNFTTKEHQQGTGIGLYMVKQIVEKLNGTITVTNENGGACFTMVFKEK